MSLRFLLDGQLRYMQQRGFDVLAVSADGPELKGYLNREEVSHRIVPMSRRITLLRDLSALLQLWRLCLAERPDIVHSQTPKAGLLAMLAARLARVPVRIHTIGGLPMETARGPMRWLLWAMEWLTCRMASEVWPNSRALLIRLKEAGICAPEKLHMIGSGSSNGVDLVRFCKSALHPQELDRVKAKLKWAPQKRYLLSVGRLVRDKGVVELVEVFSELARTREDLHLVLPGKLERVRTAETLPAETVKVLEEHPRILLPGWVEDIEYWLALADLLVHPSHREGFPNVLLQAGAMQVPVVCSDIPGNKNLVTDDRYGFLFTTGRPKALHRELVNALDQPQEADRRAERLRSRIEADFGADRVHLLMAKRYFELLTSRTDRSG